MSKRSPVVLTRRGEKVMLGFFFLAVLALISFADVLAGLL